MDGVLFNELTSFKGYTPFMKMDGGFAGASIDVAKLALSTGAIELVSTPTIAQATVNASGTVTQVSTSFGRGIVFTANTDLSAIEFPYLNISGASRVVIKDFNAGYGSTALFTQALTASPVTVTYSFQKGVKYYVLLDANGSAYTTAYPATYGTPVLPITNACVILHGFTLDGTQVSSLPVNYMTYLKGTAALPTTASFTKDITPTNVYKFLKLIFQTTLPTDTSVTCDILDTSDNVLLSNVVDGASLETIDTRTYKTIRLKFTLTRQTTGTTSPKLYSPLWSWLGGGS